MMAREKKRTKWSISLQFALIFASVLIGIVAFFLLVNTTFLERFYIRNKGDALKRAYAKVESAIESSSLDSEEFDRELNDATLRYNIDIIIIDVDSQTVKYKGKDQEAMKIAIWDKVFMGDKLPEGDIVVEQTEKYRLSITEDRRTHIGYIEMWGFLSNDNVFLHL